jgi:hypothetical protein
MRHSQLEVLAGSVFFVSRQASVEERLGLFVALPLAVEHAPEM